MADAPPDRLVGFAESGRTIPLPREFFSRLLNEVSDLIELKVTLYLLWRLHVKRSYPRVVARREILADRSFLSGLAIPGEPVRESLARGLRLATARGTFLQLRVRIKDRAEALFLLNTPGNRKAADRIVAGQLLPELTDVRPVDPAMPLERPNIFRLYEQNIGILTPLIADQLRDAELTFPPNWVEDAFREAVARNRRNWRYIQHILERWASEGKRDGVAQRDPADASGKSDSYWTGRYGHLIRH